MTKSTDIKIADTAVYFLPIKTRIPLKFGNEVLTSVTCARVKVTVQNRKGKTASGWGETPLSVQWVWPRSLPYAFRYSRMKEFVGKLSEELKNYPVWGHPVEIGHTLQKSLLKEQLSRFNSSPAGAEHLPWLAALVALSPFDIALHDAFGEIIGVPVYNTYNRQFMNRDLSSYLEPVEGMDISFKGRYPEDYFTLPAARKLKAWHLVGGLDTIDGVSEPDSQIRDGYPETLKDWIQRDGLECLKIKLKGTDADWDYHRIFTVGRIGLEENVQWFSVDFNCTVTDPSYVNSILDKLKTDYPQIFDRILYVEQPFPYDLESNRIDVHSVSLRKPLFMDESAHNWEFIRLGRELGWTGAALKTCKTQTEALLSLSWAKAHKMPVMVQDLTNPMLAQIPHVLLAAHGGTIMGVESNSMQFYPEASAPEAEIHPGLYTRRNGQLDLSTIRGSGFGYRLNEIKRHLPDSPA